MTADLLSIIIPAYNPPKKWLKAMLESLHTQAAKYPIEVIVVDDGSAEDVTWVTAYPEVIYIRQKNGGAASARSTGLDLAKGEYITFLDADDEIKGNYLDIIFENHRAGYDWVSYDWTCDGHKEWAKQLKEPLMVNCAVWAYSFRSDFIGDKRFNTDWPLGEDREWLKRVLRDDCKHKHDHRIFYNYRWMGNENSLTHRKHRGEITKCFPF